MVTAAVLTVLGNGEVRIGTGARSREERKRWGRGGAHTRGGPPFGALSTARGSSAQGGPPAMARQTRGRRRWQHFSGKSLPFRFPFLRVPFPNINFCFD